MATGAPISPTLLNLTLCGLEQRIQSVVTTSDKVNVIVYADDFVVTGATRDVLEQKVKPAIIEFLRERGLSLSEEKTKITYIGDGFDFLGFNIRKYANDKLLIKPSKSNVIALLRKLRSEIKRLKTAKTENLIHTLNPKIRGWANYFRHVCSKRTFVYIEHQLFKVLWRWAVRRHPNKNRNWTWEKYFNAHNVRRGILSTCLKNGKILSLLCPSTIPIVRHTKIRGDANPFDPSLDKYFAKLERKRKSRSQLSPEISTEMS